MATVDRPNDRCTVCNDGTTRQQCKDRIERAERARSSTLPDDSAGRKEFPLVEGLLKYFPAALAAVALVSKVGNDKHNGVGTPLHHSRGVSGDHADCIVRHLIDLFEDKGYGVGYDEGGVPQVGYIAWRALALAQEWLEQFAGAPLAPNAKVTK